jgi:GH25 family lysozyme M1 (1,4-beta-N-acetylmuramidase)
MTTLSGIDVSASGQGASFDWAAYRGKISFAGIKISQDLDYADPDAARNTADARAIGASVIGYHFLNATLDGARQAEYFLSHADGLLKPGRDLIAVDAEDEGMHGCSPAQLNEVTADFLAELRKHWAAYHGIVYTEVWLLPYLVSCGASPLWAANPGGGPIADKGAWPGGPSFEQVGQKGVDSDVFYGSSAELAKLAIPG